MNTLKVLALAATLSTSAAAVPETFLYVGDLQEDGAAANGSFSVTFQMFNDETAGTVVFAETLASIDVTDGALIHELGSSASNPLDEAELAAGELYLQVIVNGSVLSPRTPIRSVPFAARAATAESAESATNATNATNAVNATTAAVANAVADGSITLESLGSAIAVAQESGVPTTRRLLVIKKNALCGEGIDIIEDTGPGTTVEYVCNQLPCGTDAQNRLLFRVGCGSQFACTATAQGQCRNFIRIGPPVSNGDEIIDTAPVVGQLVALEPR